MAATSRLDFQTRVSRAFNDCRDLSSSLGICYSSGLDLYAEIIGLDIFYLIERASGKGEEIIVTAKSSLDGFSHGAL